ncbi:MAG: pentapeptide repeat-containing protein [Rhodococcus sp. (in: high G+C Gram-positive bacteria)]|uniref:pentapeptide repeat-containing protein n=1 Tax=Rhodococcus sp. TaxID=1831 RepID=UPI003BB6A1BD
MATSSHLSAPAGREHLRADCSRCFALCCAAFGFTRSTDFAEDKPAGTPCRHLGADHSCTVHDGLLARGFRGCAAFDCFGAGQVVSQRVFGAAGPHPDPRTMRQMFAVFPIVKQLHEMIRHLYEAQDRTYDPDTARAAGDLAAHLTEQGCGDAAALLSIDTETLHSQVAAILVDVSAEVRAAYFADGRGPDPDLTPRADLAGADLRSRRLCGADLRSACLIGADLRGCDLTATDLLGTDLRGARLDDADLSSALYVTGPQLAAARGDRRTRVPATLTSPAHWPG